MTCTYSPVVSEDKWVETGHLISVDSPQELMTVLGTIGTLPSSARFAWRGMPSSSYSVASSLQRAVAGSEDAAPEAAIRLAEEKVLKKAREWGLGVGDSSYVSDFQLLADLQHFGVPTRLIDFTSNPMTALWFACQGRADHSRFAGLLVAVDVARLRRYKTFGPLVMPFERLKATGSGDLFYALKDSSPFVLESSRPNARLLAQEGFFLASSHASLGNDRSPFIGLDLPWSYRSGNLRQELLSGSALRSGPLPFVAIRLAPMLKASMLRSLEQSYNKTEQALFPDYQGFSDWTKHSLMPLIES
jgi:hypothetical protein